MPTGDDNRLVPLSMKASRRSSWRLFSFADSQSTTANSREGGFAHAVADMRIGRITGSSSRPPVSSAGEGPCLWQDAFSGGHCHFDRTLARRSIAEPSLGRLGG